MTHGCSTNEANPCLTPHRPTNPLQRLAKEFLNGVGKELHEIVAREVRGRCQSHIKPSPHCLTPYPSLPGRLKSLQNKAVYSSYISKPWFDMYFKFRDPLPLNMNPQLTMRDDPDSTKHNQVQDHRLGFHTQCLEGL